MENSEEVELYIQAIKEQFSSRVANLTTDYEDKIAKLRVELTMTDRDRKQLQYQIESLQSEGKGAPVSEEATAEGSTSN